MLTDLEREQLRQYIPLLAGDPRSRRHESGGRGSMTDTETPVRAVRLSDETYDRLRAAASARSTTVSALLRDAIARWFRAEDRKPTGGTDDEIPRQRHHQ